jgi:ubiquinone/menaquinone biosynthesis C-methylase UbiE
MNQSEMVELIRNGIARPGGVWVDGGAGTGNFTWALAVLLGPDATIYALDRDARAITAQRARLAAEPPGATIVPRQADLTRPLALPALDGLLLANVVHFVRDQERFLQRLGTYLKPAGQLLVVEYQQTLPLPWVPFPLPFEKLAAVLGRAGFTAPTQVGLRHSRSSGQAMYAAASTWKP